MNLVVDLGANPSAVSSLQPYPANAKYWVRALPFTLRDARKRAAAPSRSEDILGRICNTPLVKLNRVTSDIKAKAKMTSNS